MNRPKPRTSALSSMSATAPAPVELDKPWDDASLYPGTDPTMPVATVKGSDTANPGCAQRTQKVTATIEADLLGRARSAFLIDGPLRGVRSFSNWISEAIEEKTTAVELDRNGGKRFPSTAPGTIPTGRRA